MGRVGQAAGESVATMLRHGLRASRDPGIALSYGAALAERRGAIIGLFGVSGAIGILIGTAGGGWLFARFGPSTPFVLFGCLNALVFLWSLQARALRL